MSNILKFTLFPLLLSWTGSVFADELPCMHNYKTGQEDCLDMSVMLKMTKDDFIPYLVPLDNLHAIFYEYVDNKNQRPVIAFVNTLNVLDRASKRVPLTGE